MKVFNVIYRICCIIAALTAATIIVKVGNGVEKWFVVAFPYEFAKYLFHAGVTMLAFIAASEVAVYGMSNKGKH